MKRLGFDATELGILNQSLVLSKSVYGVTVGGGCWASNSQKLDQVEREVVRMGVISDYKPIGDYIRSLDRKLMCKIKDNGTHRSEGSSRRDQIMPKDFSEIAITDVKGQRTTGTSKFFHIDFLNLSICIYVVIESRFFIFLFYPSSGVCCCLGTSLRTVAELHIAIFHAPV